MKIETPQILWHNGSEGNGKPAPLYSVSLLPTTRTRTRASAAGANSNPSATSRTTQDAASKQHHRIKVHPESHDILATAGNSNEIHIWKIKLTASHDQASHPSPQESHSHSHSHSHSSTTPSRSRSTREPPAKKARIFSLASPSIQHMTTLTRHERSINAVTFSPRGTHLASAGDGGTLIIHSIPSSFQNYDSTATERPVSGSASVISAPGPGRPSHKTPETFWNTIESEKDLTVKLLHTGCQDIMDLSWSPDENRIMVGTLDHTVLVYQCTVEKGILKGWKVVWKNRNEHTHYVQGVAFDPLAVYMASQGSDRSVRVWQRKPAKRSGSGSGGSGNASASGSGSSVKKVLGSQDKNVEREKDDPQGSRGSGNGEGSGAGAGAGAGDVWDVERRMGNRFDVGKAKMIKYKVENVIEGDVEKDGTANANQNANSNANTNGNVNGSSTQAAKKRHLFADESTVESFFRRLAWTADGAFLVTPASLCYHTASSPTSSPLSSLSSQSSSSTPLSPSSTPSSSSSSPSSPEPSFATCLFARHQFDKPYRILHGLEKPSVVIRPNPILFQLPNQVQVDSKENLHSSPTSITSATQPRRKDGMMPYRSIFAVLTVDSILIYDTYHSKPLCIAKGLHYAGLTDCSWSSDGHHLVVSSTDGYISIMSFDTGELGEVYTPPPCTSLSSSVGERSDKGLGHALKSSLSVEGLKKKKQDVGSVLPKVKVSLPPCEPGQRAVIVAPPAKKARMGSATADSGTFPVVNTLQVRKKVKVHKGGEHPPRHSTKDAAEDQEMNENEGRRNLDSGCAVEKDVVGGVINLSLTSSSVQ